MRSACLLAFMLGLVSTACESTDSTSDVGRREDSGGSMSEPDAAPDDDGAVVEDAGPPVEPCPAPTGPGTMHEGDIDADETWTAADSPHIVTFGVQVKQGTLTIEACAVVRVQEGHTITVGGNTGAAEAVLVAHGKVVTGSNGSVRRPVSFVPDDDATFWGALYAQETGRLDLEVVDLSGGGSHATAPNLGGTVVASGDGGPALLRNVRVVDVRIEGSEGFGINLQNFAAFDAESRDLVIMGSGQNPSTANYVTDYPIFITPPALQTIPTGTYSGNAVDAIRVLKTVDVQIDETFPNRGVPYSMLSDFAMAPADSVADGGLVTLTIEAGVQIQFSSDPANLWFLELGSSNGGLPENIWATRLVAVGTADEPIVFTSAEASPAAGAWGGIAWPGGPATGNRMEHVRIEYAGGDSGTGNFGCGPGDNSSALLIANWRPDEDFIDELTISDSAGGGIVCGWMSDADGPDLKTGNTFTNIANGCDVSRWANETAPICPGNDGVADCL